MTITNELKDFLLANTFVTSFGILVTGIALSFISVAYFVYEQPEYDERELSYEEQYYEEFCDMEIEQLSDDRLKELSEIYIREQTPKCEVIMCYDSDDENFKYWCNNKNIKFLVLDAVAHKYAIDNNAKAICVNYKEEYDKAVEAAKTAYINNKKKPVEIEDKKPSVFAKFKSYNTANKKTSRVSNNRISILTEKCNRFKHCGSIENWDDSIKQTTRMNELKQSETISVAEWLMKNKNV
jgi:hypothetical protein